MDLPFDERLLRLRLSSGYDLQYLNYWMRNDRKNLMRAFPTLEHEEFIDYSIYKWFSSFNLNASITLLYDDVPIGIGAFWLYDVVNMRHSAMFGVIIDPANQGMGFGKMLTNKMLLFAKNILELNFLELQVVDGNDIAINMYEKLGFKRISVAKDLVCIDGKYEDVILMRRYVNGGP
ncbi:MAG: GNAT family N-acetyltransferase [Chlamydiia bacterium]|nr:GNAT family N-acetyltransferase [Chlamydiia bacterium]